MFWNGWSSFSVSCGSGVKTRTRSCTNPAPSLLGRDCMDNNKDIASCSNGIKSRTRSCNNPATSLLGRNCIGNNKDIELPEDSNAIDTITNMMNSKQPTQKPGNARQCHVVKPEPVKTLRLTSYKMSLIQQYMENSTYQLRLFTTGLLCTVP